ncbi:MAG: glycosyltransferase family 39 protein [Planctomycetes bacterium]|nr:glycosyltransferase family 39 protein [Planctomycetota bacterium]
MTPHATTDRTDAETAPRVPWFWLLAPLVASAATRDLWAPDEPRYAQVGKEIFERADPIVMHLCGEVYPNKPPLVFALAGLFGRFTGWSELAMRLPTIAAIAVTAWLTLRFARRFWSESEARWSAAIYLTTAMSLWNGGRVQLDPLLGALCFGAVTLLDERARDERDARRRARWAGVLAGLGVLVKGPVSFLFIALPLVVWRFTVGKRVERTGARSTRGAVEGWVLALAIPLAWASAAIAREPSLLDEFLFKQHVGQTMDGTRHPAPFWFHFAVQPAWILPWTFAFVAGLGLAWRSWRAKRSGGADDEGLTRAAGWFVATLLLFSCFTSKRDLYLLPVYPAVGMVAARWLVTAIRARRPSRAVSVPSSLLLALVGIALAVAPFFEDEIAARASSPLPEFGIRAHVAGGVLAALALAALVQAWRGSLRSWAERLTLAFAIGTSAIAICMFPPINPGKSAREIASWVAARPEKPTSIPIWGAQPEGFAFYGIPASGTDDDEGARSLETALEREGASFLAVVEARRFEKLAPALRARLVELQRRSLSSRTMVVVGRRVD